MADAYDDDDNDELTFSKEYGEAEDGMVIPAKEATFAHTCAIRARRTRSSGSWSASPSRSSARPIRSPSCAISLTPPICRRWSPGARGHPAAARGQLEPERAGGRPRDGARVHAREDRGGRGGRRAAARGPLRQLRDEGELEGALDVAKLYAAVSASFPPPAEPAEGEEPPPPYAWAVEGAEPAGTVSAESLAEWAKCSFGYGAALLKEHGSGLTVSLLATAASEASEAVDEAAANGLYAALCSLVAYTEEAKAPPPEEE